VALLVSSNELPDVLQFGLSAELFLEYGSNGALIDQTPYIMDRAKSPHFWAIAEKDRNEMLRFMRSADGKIYNQLMWQPESWNLSPHRQYINKAWLDKLGLKVPSTTDELRNVLTAFRDRDPNGNGRKDEIGLYGYYQGTYGENTISTIINAFTFYNRDNLALDSAGTRVIAPFTEPGFRRALQYLNGLYKDGLLGASLFTDNQQQFRATLASQPPVAGYTSAGSVSNWPDADNNPNFLELAMIPPLTGPDGACYTPYTGFVPGAVGAIASRSRIPDIAWKYLESFYDHDVSIISRFGQEGVDWTRDPSVIASQTNAYVSAGLYPKITVVETSGVWGGTGAQFWYNPGPRYASEEQGNTRGSTVRPFKQDSKVAILDAYNYQWYVDKHPQYVLPPLKYTMDEARRNAQAITDVNEYVRQAVAEFTTSVRDINNDAAWNAYLRELDSMGLPVWLSTAQSAYNRTRN
jgi:putative aldouronate transport system substrate-binding protein